MYRLMPSSPLPLAAGQTQARARDDGREQCLMPPKCPLFPRWRIEVLTLFATLMLLPSAPRQEPRPIALLLMRTLPNSSSLRQAGSLDRRCGLLPSNIAYRQLEQTGAWTYLLQVH